MAKKTYAKPELRPYGTVARLTLGESGSSNDGLGGGRGRRKKRGLDDNGPKPKH